LETGKRPLVNLLVSLFAKLRSLTDTFEFAHHYRICLRLNAVRYKSTRDFVFGVLQLSVQLRKYLLFDTTQTIPAVRTVFTPIHFGLDICRKLVDILLDSTYCPTIVDNGLSAVMRDYRVNLTHVYRNHFTRLTLGWGVDFVDQ